MKDKLKKLTDAGYKVMIRTRWTDDEWDVWIYRTDHKIIEKQRPSYAWNQDPEVALDEATSLSIERAMKIIKDEREALLEFEKEASGVF